MSGEEKRCGEMPCNTLSQTPAGFGGPSCASVVEQQIKGAFGEALIEDLLTERKQERRWKIIKRSGLTFFFVASFLSYVLFYATSIGFKIMPKEEIIGVVHLNGGIGDGTIAGAAKVVPVLSKAFEAPNVKAIVIAIDSPGGQPLESERINRVIDSYKEKTKKPVVAVINNVGASAAYMVAVHADKIVAGQYSIVGSIGAIIDGWDFHEAIKKFDVKKRVFQSGVHKGMLNPWTDLSAESSKKAQSIVDGMAKTFATDVRKQRPAIGHDVDITTGEIWDGNDALKIGLIDEIGTLEDYIKKTWPETRAYDFGPKSNSGLDFLGMSMPDVLRGAAAFFEASTEK